MLRRSVLLALPLSLSAVLLAETPSTKLVIHVVNPSGKPLERASVIVRFVSGHGPLKMYRKIRTQWETKTDQEGFVRIPTIPQGKIRIQVIASNFQTFGQDFEVAESDRTIEIRMNPPQAQYSAH